MALRWCLPIIAGICFALPSGGGALADPLPAVPGLSPACHVDIDPLSNEEPLAAVGEALAAQSLTILAIGSSSTEGVGASHPTATYPARLEAHLRRAYPNARITMVNRGIGGETALGAAARMRLEVRAVRPHLVLWQLGTNGALQNIALSRFREVIGETVEWLRAGGIDLILIDPQYVRKYENHDHYGQVVEMLGGVSTARRIPLVRRFAAMRRLAETRQLSDYLAKDKFHLNNVGYQCLAEYVAQAILRGEEQAAARPRKLDTEPATASAR